jgi:hypothetical protein
MIVGLVFALATTLAGQDVKATVDGGIMMYDACTPIDHFAEQGCTALLDRMGCYNTIIDVQGFTQVDLHKSGKHVSVHVLFHNTGQEYQTNLEANQQFDKAPYYVPFHSVFTSVNGGSTFKMNGTLEVGQDADGKWFSSVMLFDPNHPLTLACTTK